MRKFNIYIILFLFSTITVVAQNNTIQLSLDSCLNMAVTNNIDIKKSELEILAAEQQKKAAFTKYFPNISGMAFGFMANQSLFELGISDIGNAAIRDIVQNIYNEIGASLGIPNSIEFFQNGVMAGVSAVQPIFAGGRIVAGNKLANVGIEATELQSKITELSVKMKAEEMYWQIISLNEKRKTIHQGLTLIDTLSKDADIAIQAGLINKNEKLKADLERNKLSSTLIQVENGIRLSKMALSQHIGINYDSIEIVLIDTALQAQEPWALKMDNAQAVNLRSEKMLLDLNVKAKELERRMLLGESLPQMAFGGSYSYNNLLKKDRFNLIGFASIQLPISAWWETGHKLKMHSLKIEIAEQQRTDLTQKMSLQTQQIWDELEASYRQTVISSEAVKNAKENLIYSQDYYDAGLQSLSELIEAQTLYRQALDAQADAAITYKIKASHYQSLTGKQ